MRKRIYWLLPDLASARRVMDDMLLARIDERHIHFVARDDVDLSGLHAANTLQTSDVVRAAQMGGMIGAALGAALGTLAALQFSSGEAPAPQALVLALAALGAVFGIWTASMIGVSTPSQRLRRFEPAIARGAILLMVDVPRGRVEAIEAQLEQLHPEAHLEGLEPNIPAFP
ncbi:MAG: DUF1269 domain-containing protein [Burkholderiaceae bacterium]|nr:DUF1269 domain-containing protein [Burkholderiaceae bacterium]